jgi:TonB-dependent SusC/RagA subfamily outer membrane receptor
MLLSVLTLVGCNDDMADIAKTLEQTENIDKTFNINISDEEFKGLRCYASIPSNVPIYIIDGLPVSEEKLKQIQPNEIKSITVLKGVKATALYGSRAKDGVISINLKQ